MVGDPDDWGFDEALDWGPQSPAPAEPLLTAEPNGHDRAAQRRLAEQMFLQGIFNPLGGWGL